MNRISRRSLCRTAAYIGMGLANPTGVLAAASREEVFLTMETALGPIDLAVNLVRAPLSAGDFLRYVDLRLFEGGSFYRTVRPDNDINPVKISAVQGGAEEDKYLPPIPHETTSQTGLRHRNGTLSLGRTLPGSAVGGSFFICIGDQPELDFGGRRNPDGLGFAAFGRVRLGMRVVHKIWRAQTNAPDDGMGGQMISRPISIVSVRRI